ncbi:MAG: hypothetical protein IAE91_06460, partial [Ignavibacteriaceae bacterium]|nr:hypothetical protein [Ignavibacteriaceae bacterium]
MKTSVRSLYILIIIAASLRAQEGWYYQLPNQVFDMYIISNNNVIAVGDGIWKTTDKGISWEGKYPGFDYDTEKGALASIDFANSLTGYSCGGTLMVKTNNGGNSWTKISTNLNNPNFRALSVLDANTCLAIAQVHSGANYTSYVIKTTDGGDNWFTVRSDAGLMTRGITFAGGSTFYVTAYARTILKTTDAGTSWNVLQIPSDAIDQPELVSVDFFDQNHGIVTGRFATKVAVTANGGVSWTGYNTNPQGNEPDISYLSNGTAYLGIGNGQIFKSINNGQNWSSLSSNLTFGNTQISFENASFGVAFVNSGVDYNFTIDGGNSWSRSALRSGEVAKIPPSGYIATNYNDFPGYEGVLKSSDGFRWEFVESTSPFSRVLGYSNFQFLDPNLGFSLANYQVTGTNYSIALMKTTNGGRDWLTLRTSLSINDYHFVNPQYGWVCYSSGQIYKTLDSGKTWGQQTTNFSSLLGSIFFIDENNGWASGWDGCLLRTTNGGLLWDRITIPGFTTSEFNRVVFYDAQRGYLAGRKRNVSNDFTGVVLKTNDGGLTWTEITPPGVNNVIYGKNFFMKGPAEIYISNISDNTIIQSNDAGASWQRINLPYIGGMYVVNSEKIYLFPQSSGGLKSILLVTKGFVTSVREIDGDINVSGYELFQNYPNPFNPETIIRYSIPFSSGTDHVKLILYDIQGNEVGILVDEVHNSCLLYTS